MSDATRLCADCGTDISERQRHAKRCVLCSDARQRALSNAWRDRTEDCADADPGEACTPGRLRRGRCRKHYRRSVKRGDVYAPTRNCEACGIEFTPTRADAVCCSKECTGKKWRLARRVDIAPRVCPECGETFIPKRSDSRYCERRCLVKAAWRAQYQPKINIIVCAYCTEQFSPTRSDAIYCGSSCNKRAYYEANRTHLLAASVQWMRNNRHARRNIIMRRRARIRGNKDSVGVQERDWRRLVARYKGRCAYCQRKPDVLHMDHIVPIARGGRHGIGNIIPACGDCNHSKGSKLLMEWRLWRKRVSACQTSLPAPSLTAWASPLPLRRGLSSLTASS